MALGCFNIFWGAWMKHLRTEIVPKAKSLTGAAVIVLAVTLLGLVSCRSTPQPANTTERIQIGYRTFQGATFFTIEHPTDWVGSDLPDGANLFYTGEILFVRVKIVDVPDRYKIDERFGETIQREANLHGGEPTLVKSGQQSGHPYRWYEITKPNGARLEEVLIYNEQLQLLYVIYGSASEGDYEEFSSLFARMVESFDFKISSSHPSANEEEFELDQSTLAGAWAGYLEGLRTRDLDLLTASQVSINAPRLLNEMAVEEVRDRYFPYDAPVRTLVVAEDKGEKVAMGKIALRTLPPEGYLQVFEREFILEDGKWKVLRFE